MDPELTDSVVTDVAPSEAAPAAVDNTLVDENARLREENRRRSESKRREIALLLAELRDSGQLTPAMEYAGIEEALVTAEEQALAVQLPGGQTLPFSKVLADVLRALPCSYVAGCCCEGGSADLAAQLNADEQRIAQSLGLSMAEFAEIRNA